MSNKEKTIKPEFFDQIVEEEKKIDVTDPCDPSNPDYPWVPCGLDKKDKKNKK